MRRVGAWESSILPPQAGEFGGLSEVSRPGAQEVEVRSESAAPCNRMNGAGDEHHPFSSLTEFAVSEVLNDALRHLPTGNSGGLNAGATYQLIRSLRRRSRGRCFCACRPPNVPDPKLGSV